MAYPYLFIWRKLYYLLMQKSKHLKMKDFCSLLLFYIWLMKHLLLTLCLGLSILSRGQSINIDSLERIAKQIQVLSESKDITVTKRIGTSKEDSLIAKNFLIENQIFLDKNSNELIKAIKHLVYIQDPITNSDTTRKQIVSNLQFFYSDGKLI